jgi:hypothetical protein
VRTGALERVIGRTAARGAGERCELCAEAVPDAHAHVLDESSGEPLCVCRACTLLFEREAAGRGHYRLIPDRVARLTGVRTADLGVPVGLAFFVLRPDGGVTAHYPSPAGVTRWDVDRAAWDDAVASCSPALSLRPAVEALLIGTLRGRDEQWLVPLDRCYRLVAAVRLAWTGLHGGGQVATEIDRFFGELAASVPSGGREEK